MVYVVVVVFIDEVVVVVVFIDVVLVVVTVTQKMATLYKEMPQGPRLEEQKVLLA